MDYKTVLALKEAGFPQGTELSCACAFLSDEEKESQGTKRLYNCNTERVYVPTLEELIEACGDEFHNVELTGVSPAWIAKSKTSITATYSELHGLGETPTEAVAKLWLALHKK